MKQPRRSRVGSFAGRFMRFAAGRPLAIFAGIGAGWISAPRTKKDEAPCDLYDFLMTGDGPEVAPIHPKTADD